MPRQANGTYLAPANTAAISGQSISSTAFNTLETDIGTEITNSVDRGGRSAMTAALPMGAQKITGMADPTVATDGATKNYVDTTTATFFSTGDVKLTIKTVADTGWVLFDDGTIGSATSGATSYANALAQPLFNLIFNNISDANAPIFTSGGGATTRAGQTNAATAWAANCRISLTKTLGRALGIAGAGSGLTSRALGVAVGSETAALATTNLPPQTPSGTVTGSAGSGQSVNGASPGTGGAKIPTTSGGTASADVLAVSLAFNGTAFTGQNSTAFSIMQPITFLNAMIKI